MTLINHGIFYQNSKPDKTLYLQLIDEAIIILLPFHHIPYIQNYLRTAFEVLQDWGIDVEAHLNSLTAKQA